MNYPARFVAKTPTGTRGLDEITQGGIPSGRNTLICGGPGSGKTLFAMKYLLCGAIEYREPGLCITFEENAKELAENVRSLGFEVSDLIERRLLAIDDVVLASDQVESGPYDLSGLFLRIERGMDGIGAQRVVLDSIEALFAGIPNESIVRSELQRLFRWLKEKGVTTVITAEAGNNTLTRYGLEEYVADCVIQLDHRVYEQISTRRLRIVKYRGSAHGTNEYPFLLEESGLTVMPITSVGLSHKASGERVSSGIEGVDEMLEGRGFYSGSSILVSGTAGTGKSIFAAAFAVAACERGEKALYFAFEESPSQIERNMKSVGIDLVPWTSEGKLIILSSLPTSTGLEAHLARMHRDIEDFHPSVVVVDPVTNLVSAGDSLAAKLMLTRLVDYLKSMNITGMFTDLRMSSEPAISISSLMDTWIVLRQVSAPVAQGGISGQRHRTIELLKSRGMAHSTRRETFKINDSGIQMLLSAVA